MRQQLMCKGYPIPLKMSCFDVLSASLRFERMFKDAFQLFRKQGIFTKFNTTIFSGLIKTVVK